MTGTNWEARVTEEMAQDTISLRPQMSLKEAAAVLRQHRVSGAPVVNEQGRAIGVLSQSDLIAHMVDLGVLEGSVDDVMTSLAVSLPEDVSMARAAAVMATEGIHRMPILNKNGELVGLISSMDVVRWVAKNEGLLPGQHEREE